MNVSGRYIPDSLSLFLFPPPLLFQGHMYVVLPNYIMYASFFIWLLMWNLQLFTTYLCTILTVWQNEVVSLDPFSPKEVTAHDREAGLCIVSQFPTQALQMASANEPSQFISPLDGLRSTSPQAMVHKIDDVTRSDSLRDEANQTRAHSKRARILEDEGHDALPGVHLKDPHCNMNYNGDSISKDNGEVPHIGSDVAAVIEDLVEQTSKVNKDPLSFY